MVGVTLGQVPLVCVRKQVEKVTESKPVSRVLLLPFLPRFPWEMN